MSNGEETKKVISLEELEEHKTLKSLWIAIHNKVYDVTEFVDEVYFNISSFLYRKRLEQDSVNC